MRGIVKDISKNSRGSPDHGDKKPRYYQGSPSFDPNMKGWMWAWNALYENIVRQSWWSHHFWSCVYIIHPTMYQWIVEMNRTHMTYG